MANKRQLKKAICRSCGEIAGVCLTSQAEHDEANYNEWDQLVIDTALLQVKTVKGVNARFKQKVKDYPTPQAYRKARKAFHKECVKQLADNMNKQVAEIAHRINELMPNK
ncbi:MAG: hypothetical protein IKR25_01220 [Muribaculaceae bacterium]|nr:hypothetical protein [Muribaculaceae bacterium]